MKKRILVFCFAALFLAIGFTAYAATAYVHGYMLDPNWYSPHRSDSSMTGLIGTGLYEYGVSGNVNNSSALGFNYGTDIWGAYTRMGMTGGTYTMASWDVWWRSDYIFNRPINNGFAPVNYIKQHANMWTYAMNWGNHETEFGQSFRATGKSVVMIVVYTPDSGITWKVSVHEGGPGGRQLGRSQRMDGPGDLRFRWSGDEIQTIPGNMYYVKLQPLDKTTNLPKPGALGESNPIPDMSDPMPDGCMYVNGVPQGGLRDLALTICSDDDGMLTGPYISKAETWNSVSSAGQSFTARGTSLVSFCAWMPQNTVSFCAKLYDAVNGTQIGSTKTNRVMRGGDPEVMWLWNPGECELVPGQIYYIEVTREDGLSFPIIVNRWDQYYSGQAYKDKVAQPGWDLSCTTMEEESPGSAAKPQLEMKSPVMNNWPYQKDYRPYPVVLLADRGPDSVTIRWESFFTDYSTVAQSQVTVPADATIEYSEWTTPYTDTYYDSTLTSSHAVTLSNLKPNTLYHCRVKSTASGYKTAVSQDLTFATTSSPDVPNLLVNPGFEEGSGASPRAVTGWTCSGMDIKASNGTWFWGIPGYEGSWLCQATVNGSGADGLIYQRVAATPGSVYKFTCAISSWMRENNNWKYDVWNRQGRVDSMRIGIDPTGGTNPLSSAVQWSNRFYSHLRYTNQGVQATAQSDYVTVFISLQGAGGEWHVFGVDDCRLTAAAGYTAYELDNLKAQHDGTGAQVSDLIITATPDEAGAYYAQTENRSQGIRIESADTVAVGQKVAVKGTLQSLPSGERYLANSSFSGVVDSTEPAPVMMLASSVGGSAMGTMPAVPASKGPHNTALAVKIAGTVTAKAEDSSYIFISDGSLSGDGIKVDTSYVSAVADVPNIGDVVSVSGISSIYSDGGIKPIIIARRSGDISLDLNP